MDIEENDEIEKEIDIIYSGQFSNETKIFQFPLIPKNLMNIDNINSLSISQNSKTMKMEMKIDEKYLDKNNYNATPLQNLKGEKIENNSNLCLGIMKNNKLILTPISQIFQFRHDFSNINKEKTLSLKIKGKKDQKNIGIKKEEKDDIKFSPLYPHLPNSIDSKIMLEKISNLEGEPQKANFMNKDDYFNFLLKYVITPDTEGDTNDDFLALYKNKYSNSFLESVKEDKNEDENMVIEEKIKEGKKSNKKSRGFNSGLDVIKNKDNDIITSYNNYGIINNVINNIFENEECIEYDNLLMNICQKMGIEITDPDKINQIKKEIEENCILIKNKYCFLKDNESDIKEVRNFLIKEIGNNENGLKKQQIKKLIEQNGLNISDNKLTKLLQKICKYQGNAWIIKLPSNF